MREVTNREKIEQFMASLGRDVKDEVRVFLVGGATAVLYGWRETTVDVDLRLEPDSDEVLRGLPALKERLRMNVELASPLDFIPVRDDWMERSPFVSRHGRAEFRHFDLNAQALAKIERDHEQDRADVWAMLGRGLVTTKTLADYFAAIEPLLYRYPALDPPSFKARLERLLEERGS